MRHFFTYLLLIVCIPLLSQEYKIELDIKGANNQNAQFAYYESDKQFVVQNGKFDKRGRLVFSGKSKLPHGIYFIVVGKDFFDVLIRDEQSFKLKTDTSNLIMSMKVTGSKENQIFFDYQKDVHKLKTKIGEFEDKIKLAGEDSTLVAKYKIDKEKLDAALLEIPNNVKKQHPDSYIVKILDAMSIYDADKFDFADSELLLTPFYYNKIRLFIKKNIEKNYQYINYDTQRLLRKIKHEKANYQYVVTYLLNFYNTFYKVGINRVFIYIADNHFLPDKADWFNKDQLKQIKKRRDVLAQSLPGKDAHDLTLESTSGEYFSLLQTDAETTFLYFWSPGCGHCTKATKILQKNYPKLLEKNIKIFAVNIDDNKRQWLEKIEELQTEWVNCYDPNNESNFREKYYVYGSPLLYVIDKNKKITDFRNGEVEIENLVKTIVDSKE